MSSSPDSELPTAGSARHAAWLYTPHSQRAALAAQLCLEREIAASSEQDLAHEVAHARLQWWQQETTRLADGNGAHPLSRLLQQHAAGAATPPPDLRNWVQAVAERLARVAWVDRAEFHGHLQRWCEGVWLPAAQLLAGPGGVAAAHDTLAACGTALRELELLGAMARDARRGMLPLPLDELRGANCSTSDCHAQPWSAPLAALVGERVQAARRQLAESANKLPAPAWPALRGFAAWMAVADRQARRMQAALPLQWNPQADGFRAAAGDAWAAWRAARRAQRATSPLAHTRP